MPFPRKSRIFPKDLGYANFFPMGRIPTFPPLFGEIKCISITNLKQYGYLKPGYRSGQISFSRAGQHTGTVNLTVILIPETGKGTMILWYTTFRDREICYNVTLTAIPSNLGIGQRWYFICARTGKRCTKLHIGNDGYFQHRTGIPGAYYDCQTRSQFFRCMYIALFRYKHPPRKRYEKSHYRGKPVKRYLRYERPPGKHGGALAYLVKLYNVEPPCDDPEVLRNLL